MEVPSTRRLFTSGDSSLLTAVYNPKAVFPHAASLGQGFPHCRSLSTAASRRSLGRISVPVWPVILSDRLPIVALVGHYPANKLMGRGLLLKRQVRRSLPFPVSPCEDTVTCGISHSLDSASQVKPSVISTAQLNALLQLHLHAYIAGGLPATLLPNGMRDLILKRVSRLDAFSGYLCQT